MIREKFDLLVIGAGINGCGIARDAAGRGIAAALVDAGDIGGATSSASTKLIHGGLRYLEFREFDLVRKALAERSVVLAQAPHLAWALPFVLPLSKDTRPAWMIRLGLFLYDRLAKRGPLPRSRRIRLKNDIAGRALDGRCRTAFRYWDGWVDDSRLSILNAQDAYLRGAEIIPRDAVKNAFHAGKGWLVVLESGRELYARQIVNATGPWAEDVARSILRLEEPPNLSLVQGAHIVVSRVGRQRDAYMLQQPDGRIVFVIPYKERYTLIGTTETPVAHPGAAEITPEETAYLLAAVNRYLAKPLDESDIVASFAGIRPLVLEDGRDARETSREWKTIVHKDAPALTVVGGKLTTYRILAEAVLEQLYPRTKKWTAGVPLPGGGIPLMEGRTPREAYQLWLKQLKERRSDYDPDIVERLASLYGTRAEVMLEEGLGRNLGGMFERELDYLVDEEWARAPEDVLWRRTKLGLSADEPLRSALDRYFSALYTGP